MCRLSMLLPDSKSMMLREYITKKQHQQIREFLYHLEENDEVIKICKSKVIQRYMNGEFEEDINNIQGSDIKLAVKF